MPGDRIRSEGLPVPGFDRAAIESADKFGINTWVTDAQFRVDIKKLRDMIYHGRVFGLVKQPGVGEPFFVEYLKDPSSDDEVLVRKLDENGNVAKPPMDYVLTRKWTVQAPGLGFSKAKQ